MHRKRSMICRCCIPTRCFFVTVRVAWLLLNLIAIALRDEVSMHGLIFFSGILFPGVIETADVLVAGTRGIARRLGFLAGGGLGNLLGRMKKSLSQSRADSLASRQEVEIMYFGRASEFLMVTSERMVIPDGRYTLGQLLCSLYKRGEQWAYELDDSHLMCTVNGQYAGLFDTIAPGAEICISSRKTIFEA
jgi:molybdopterin converting factor small subunit